MKYLYTYRNKRGHNKRVLLDVSSPDEAFVKFHKIVKDYEILTAIYETRQIY